MHTCAQNCTTSMLVVHQCAQMCAELCAILFIMQNCLCTSVHKCGHICTMFAQVCTNVHKYATMCTSMHKFAQVRMHMCFGRIRCYLYSRDILFFGRFLLHQDRFPPYGSEISESCGAVSSVTERHPTMCTLVYTILPHLPKC